MARRRLHPLLVLAVAAMSVVGLTGIASASSTYGADWQMNETTGPMIDSSGNHNNSTIIEPGVTRDGSVYHFDNGRVEVPSSPSDTPGARDFTLTARIHLDEIVSMNYVQKGVHTLTGQEI